MLELSTFDSILVRLDIILPQSWMGDGRWGDGGMGRWGDWGDWETIELPFTSYLLPLTSHLTDPVTKPAPVGFDYFVLGDKVDGDENGKDFGCPAMSATCLRCAFGTDGK